MSSPSPSSNANSQDVKTRTLLAIIFSSVMGLGALLVVGYILFTSLRKYFKAMNSEGNTKPFVAYADEEPLDVSDNSRVGKSGQPTK